MADDDFTPDKRTMMTYALGGWVVVGLVVFVIVLALGGAWYYALAAGFFVGLFVGGGLGFLAGGRVDQLGTDDA